MEKVIEKVFLIIFAAYYMLTILLHGLDRLKTNVLSFEVMLMAGLHATYSPNIFVTHRSLPKNTQNFNSPTPSHGQVEKGNVAVSEHQSGVQYQF